MTTLIRALEEWAVRVIQTLPSTQRLQVTISSPETRADNGTSEQGAEEFPKIVVSAEETGVEYGCRRIVPVPGRPLYGSRVRITITHLSSPTDEAGTTQADAATIMGEVVALLHSPAPPAIGLEALAYLLITDEKSTAIEDGEPRAIVHTMEVIALLS